MSGVVPTVGEIAGLNDIVSQPLRLKLFSNDIVPDEATSVGLLTEVTGGGYAEFTYNTADWNVAGSSPSTAVAPAHNFTFTGPTSAPGTVYGVYILDASNIVRGVERFEASVLP